MKQDAPQTMREAAEWGWHWLCIRCSLCRHQVRRHFDSFAALDLQMPLGRLRRRMKCRACGARDVALELETKSSMPGNLSAASRRLAFDGDRAVSESRNQEA